MDFFSEKIKKSELITKFSFENEHELYIEIEKDTTRMVEMLILYSNSITKTPISIEKSHQINLITSFIQCQRLVKYALCRGYYIQSASILKQEVEILCRIKEEFASRQKEGKTPNISNYPQYRGIYGRLNDISHISHRKLNDNLFTLTMIGKYNFTSMKIPTFLPLYRREYATELFKIKIILDFHATSLLGELIFEKIKHIPQLAINLGNRVSKRMSAEKMVQFSKKGSQNYIKIPPYNNEGPIEAIFLL